MFRALLLLSPWLLVGGCVSFVTGGLRIPTASIGYELLFGYLWEPVAWAGLMLALASLPLLVWAWVTARAGTRASLARTRNAIGPLVLVGAVVVLLTISSAAHSEAEIRMHEMAYVATAELDDTAPPPRTTVWFHEDWRQTAHISRSLYLAAMCCFVGWLVLRAWLVGRAGAVNTGQVQS